MLPQTTRSASCVRLPSWTLTDADAGAPGAGNPRMTALEARIVNDEQVGAISVRSPSSCGRDRRQGRAPRAARWRRRGPTRRGARRGSQRARARASGVRIPDADRQRHETGTADERVGHYSAQIRRATDAQADSVGVSISIEDVGNCQPVLARLDGRQWRRPRRTGAPPALRNRCDARSAASPRAREDRGHRASASAATPSAPECRAARSAGCRRGCDRRCAPWRDRAARCCRTPLVQIRAADRRPSTSRCRWRQCRTARGRAPALPKCRNSDTLESDRRHNVTRRTVAVFEQIQQLPPVFGP